LSALLIMTKAANIGFLGSFALYFGYSAWESLQAPA
jgi:hypothetical protein